MIKRYIKHLPKIFRPIMTLSYLLFWFFPRKKERWVFGSGVGNNFSDNAKYLFLYSSKRSEVDSYWISANIQLVKNLQDLGLQACYKYSFKGLWISLSAKVYIYDSRINGINHWTSAGAFKVNLWHGSPLKTIDRDVTLAKNMFYIGNHTFGLHRYWVRFLNPECFVTPNLMIATSEKIKRYFMSAFGLNNIEVTGYPRNDIIKNPNLYSEYLGFEQKIITSITTEKKILYTPTFRDTDRFNREIPIEWERLNDLLKKNNTTFLIKLHRNDYSLALKEDYSNISLLDNKSDIYPLFAIVDLLITDYSSIFFDFLLTNKPILFYPYDKDTYLTKDRSMYDDYDSVTPGHKAYNFEEFYNKIELFFSDPEVLKSTNLEYDKIKDLYNKYQDDMSSERTFRKIIFNTIK